MEAKYHTPIFATRKNGYDECRVRLRARTPPFHGGDTGSNPVRGTRFCKDIDRQGIAKRRRITQTTTQTNSSMSQSERFSWTEPMLCHYNHDLKRSWFVHFNYTDHLTGVTKRIQFRGYINKIKNKEERLKQGNALRLYWKKRLQDASNPLH